MTKVKILTDHYQVDFKLGMEPEDIRIALVNAAGDNCVATFMEVEGDIVLVGPDTIRRAVINLCPTDS